MERRQGTARNQKPAMIVSRRSFIERAGSVLGAAGVGAAMEGCHGKGVHSSSKWPGFKYAICNESFGRLSWEEQCRITGEAGYKGIEVAAFTLVEQGVQEISRTRRKQMVAAMRNAGIECVGLHWLLAPPPKGLHFTTPDSAVRRRTLAYFDRLIDFCGDLGGSYMIFGSPRQRNSKGISVEQARRNFAYGLAQAADHAHKRGIKILIEPLGKKATDVVNTMAEALEVAKRVDHRAVKIMFDIHNTSDETEDFDVLIRKYFQHMYHMHVQEMNGKHLGTGTAVRDFVKAFQALKDLKYDKWISLEVFDFSPGGKRIAEESMRALKQIERQLV